MKRNVNGYRWNDDRMQAIYINIVVNLFFVKIANYCLHPTHDLSVYGMGSWWWKLASAILQVTCPVILFNNILGCFISKIIEILVLLSLIQEIDSYSMTTIAFFTWQFKAFEGDTVNLSSDTFQKLAKLEYFLQHCVAEKWFFLLFGCDIDDCDLMMKHQIFYRPNDASSYSNDLSMFLWWFDSLEFPWWHNTSLLRWFCYS